MSTDSLDLTDPERIAKYIRSAPVSTLPQRKAEEYGGTLNPLEIASQVLDGKIDPDEVPDLALAWANKVIDVPYVPESWEAAALEQAGNLVCELVIELVDELAGAVEPSEQPDA